MALSWFLRSIRGICVTSHKTGNMGHYNSPMAVENGVNAVLYGGL